MTVKRRKKRKVNVFRLLVLIILFLLIVGLIIFGVYSLFNTKEERKLDDEYFNNINTLDSSEVKQFDFDLNSTNYMLIRLNDFKVLYGSGIDERIYPASLTKVVTMNALVNNVTSLDETSSLSSEQMNELINENASIAYLKTDYDYSLRELLYALILPSGADGAMALSNYSTNHGIDLVIKMNELVSNLKLTNTHFTNTTGLHDDDLYTSLNDYSKLFINTLLNSDAKKVLKTLSFDTIDRTYNSTMKSLGDIETVKILGGKTGFTGQAGECIAVVYEVNNRSYLLLLSGAYGEGSGKHFEDVIKIMNELYN